jgi:hypothetical protein
MPAPTPPEEIAAVPTTPDRNAGEDVFVPTMYTFLNYFAPFKVYLESVVTYCSDAVTWVASLVSSAETSATTATGAAASATASAASALQQPGTNATSTSTITPAFGANAFTLAQTGKNFVVGQFVTVSDSSSPATKYFNGAITAFDAGTGAITVYARDIVGSGSSSSWVITASAPSNGERFLSPVQAVIALGNVSGTVNIDLRAGLWYSCTIIGNTTFTFTMPNLYGTGWGTDLALDITRSGSYTVGFPVGTKWSDGAQPTLVVGEKNQLIGTWDGGANAEFSRSRKAVA